jgi:class 3 adenylate cyclase
LEGHALSCPKSGADSAAPSKASESNAFASRIVTILFADAVGFSKLTEDEVPRFVQDFLGAIAQLFGKFRASVIARNTWGDGLYFVFSEVDLAGKFALELAHLVGSTRWEEKGLRGGLNLRIALHAGPVYEFDDPITGNRSYSGTHVSRAARIEPITPPGQVYASEAFAAPAAARKTGSLAITSAKHHWPKVRAPCPRITSGEVPVKPLRPLKRALDRRGRAGG